MLFAACVLHDIGLTQSADTGARFEVDGAAAVLRTHGMTPERVMLVWDAIALHASVGIAERSRPEVSLTRAGITMDFGHDADLVPDDVADAIHEALPRLDLARRITDDIVHQAHGRPAKARPGTFAGELVRERATPAHVTGMEQGTWAGRWGSRRARTSIIPASTLRETGNQHSTRDRAASSSATQPSQHGPATPHSAQR